MKDTGLPVGTVTFIIWLSIRTSAFNDFIPSDFGSRACQSSSLLNYLWFFPEFSFCCPTYFGYIFLSDPFGWETSTNNISNSSHESKVCIKLHSSSELSVVLVFIFTCWGRHIRAKLSVFLAVFTWFSPCWAFSKLTTRETSTTPVAWSLFRTCPGINPPFWLISPKMMSVWFPVWLAPISYGHFGLLFNFNLREFRLLFCRCSTCV